MDGCASDEESPLGQINSIPFGGDTFKPAGLKYILEFFCNSRIGRWCDRNNFTIATCTSTNGIWYNRVKVLIKVMKTESPNHCGNYPQLLNFNNSNFLTRHNRGRKLKKRSKNI